MRFHVMLIKLLAVREFLRLLQAFSSIKGQKILKTGFFFLVKRVFLTRLVPPSDTNLKTTENVCFLENIH